jgi:meso-butanediol dehydrogenase/(S,S)-butanediol dehydrogenase/diacetyl reductase
VQEPQRLFQRVIFLTGGSSGIGWECAKAYVREGATVVIAALDDEALRSTVAELGPPHAGYVCDVSSSEQVAAAIAQTIEQHGRLDAIHNNAGVPGPSATLENTTDEQWDELFNVNVQGILHTTRYGLNALRESRGCILNTSSIVGAIGQSSHAAYVATKGAINALTQAMALDYAHLGVRVNAICPAGVWTPMLRQWASSQPDPSSISSYLDHIHPLGRCPEGDVVADASVFLLSDQARFITGHLMHVTGGAELGYRRLQ